jgi:antitoxin component of MazEF toxin-antitoxin module
LHGARDFSLQKNAPPLAKWAFFVKMNRKLIKQGGTGLTVYVPKKWVDRLKLKPGDEVSVEEDGNKLILSPESILKEKTIKLDATKLNENSLRIALSLLYWQGYNKIEITNKNKFSFTGINRIVDNFIGMVITEQADHQVIVQNTIKENSEDLDKIINKLFITVKYMFTYLLENFSKNLENDSEILELRNSILKQSNYCQKLIFVNNFGREKTYEYDVLVLMLKKISGSLFFLSRNKLPLKKTESYLKKSLTWFNDLHSSFLKKDSATSLDIYELLNKEKIKLYKDQNDNVILGAMIEHMFSLSLRVVSITL